MFFACGGDGDFDILAKGREKFDQSAHGEVTGTIAGQSGDARLLDAEDFGSFGLCQAAIFDDGINL